MMLRGGFWENEKVAVVVSQLILCLMLAVGTERVASAPLAGLSASSGEIGFGPVAGSTGPVRTRGVSVVLRHYQGKPITALQLTVVCDWPYKLEAVTRGRATTDSLAWNLFSDIRHGSARSGVFAPDTIRIVLLSASLNGLGPVNELDILTLQVRPPAEQRSAVTSIPTLRVTDIVGALSSGDNAGLGAGAPKSLLEIPR